MKQSGHYENNHAAFDTPSTFNLKSVWEIPSNLKCPVIGTCLSLDEQTRILKKTGFITKRQAPYTIHSTIMSFMGEENKVSLKVDRTIRQKYRDAIPGFTGKDEAALRKLWNEKFETGDIGALFYVVATHPRISDSFLLDAYGEIHMMGHANMGEIMKYKKALQQQVDANQNLSRSLEVEREKGKAFKKENKRLLKHLEKERAEQVSLTQKNDTDTESVKRENQRLKSRVNTLEHQAKKDAENLRLLERKRRKLEIKLFDFQSANTLLMEELTDLMGKLFNTLECSAGCDESCPKFRLCEKRILIVGGIPKIKQFYKKFIESHGGEIDYHDGYMNGNNKNLEDRVLRSDLILCPVNCNSHNACSKVKKICKKHNKPVKMLPSSSVSTISNALKESFQMLN